MKWVRPAVFALMMIGAAASSHDLAAAQTDNIWIIPDPELIGPGTKVTVLVADGGLNASPNRIDEYEAQDVELVTFGTDRSEVEEAVPDLEETDENTGIFMFEIQLVTDEQACEDDDLGDAQFEAQGGSDPSIGVCPGDILSIEYDDGEAVISSSVEIKSWDPEFVEDRESYSTGDRIVVNITDSDANRDPEIADTIRDIRVRSDSDQVGEEFSALETGDNTGIFRLVFTTSLQPQGNAIVVTEDDDLSVEYTDEFPADFVTTTTEKTFIFTMLFGDRVATTLTSSPPMIGADGTPVAGKQATLSTVVTNSADEPRSFVELIEVRDHNGVTVFLAWQSGTLDPLSQTQIGVSWTPDRPGDYEVRTFAISDFENPQILSPIQESDIAISTILAT